MIVIFGFRTRAAVLATLSLACRNGHVAAHRIVKITRWFTLFFIPVIPFNRKYRSVCIQCGLTLEIPRENAEELASRFSPEASSPVEPIAPPLPASAPRNPALPPAGWYPDPAGGNSRRYWDGQAWTEMVDQ